MDEIQVFQLPNVLGEALLSLWREQQLCDVSLVSCDGTALPAHRVVLAAGASYFRGLWASSASTWREAGSTYLTFPQYTTEQLGTLLCVLYEQRVQVNARSVSWLLDLGNYFQVPPLVAACCKYLSQILVTDNAVEVLLLSHHHQQEELQQQALVFVARRLPALLSSTSSRAALSALPLPVLLELLGHEELLVDSELDVLSLIGCWVGADPAQRSACLPELLGLLAVAELPHGTPLCQHLPLEACATHPLGATAVAALQRHMAAGSRCTDLTTGSAVCPARQEPPSCLHAGSLMLRSTPVWRDVDQGPGAPGTPCAREAAAAGLGTISSTDCSSSSSCGSRTCTMRSALSSTVKEAPASCSWRSANCTGADHLWGPRPSSRRRGGRASKLLVVGGHDLSWRTCSSTELLDPTTGTWTTGSMLPGCMAYGFAGAARLGRGVAVVEGAMFSSRVARYDPANDTWSNGLALPTPRMHAAVASAAGMLYVLGGRNQVSHVLPHMEAWSPEGVAWRQCAPLATPRYALGAAALGGRLYAVAGSSAKSSLGCVEEYDLERDAWASSSARLVTPRKYAAAVSWQGRIVVVGGVTEPRARLAGCEALDPREGRWMQLPDMLMARSSCGAAVLGDALWVVGGNAGDTSLHSSSEVLDAAAGRWREGPALSGGRSGLAIVSV